MTRGLLNKRLHSIGAVSLLSPTGFFTLGLHRLGPKAFHLYSCYANIALHSSAAFINLQLLSSVVCSSSISWRSKGRRGFTDSRS